MTTAAPRPATGQTILETVEAIAEAQAEQGAQLTRLLLEIAELERKVNLLLADRAAPAVRHAGPAPWRKG